MKYKLLFLFCFLTFLCNAQENCNNGIDDDSDGKIDLNDSDCICKNSEITSIIPNPSFEDFKTCPNEISQLNYASSWEQASVPTTDYFNTCGYTNNAGMTPFPDGKGAVGAFFAKDWQEYLGACLTNPMKAGTSYQLTFNIASKPATGDVNLGDNGIINYGPIDIVLYGKADCTGFPLLTTGCPSAWDSSWVVLGSMNYTPFGEWGVLSITFTPSTDINTVILGSPCTLPPNYEWGETGTAPFFYFDNLLLNTSAAFGVNISQTGIFCDNNLVLTAVITKPVSTKKTFQWYKDGIAINGAVKESYKVPSFATNLGKYSVKVTDGGDCFTSTSLTINNTIPGPALTSIQPNCIEPTGTINVVNPASQYSFDNGLTWQDSSKKEFLPLGTYYVKIKTLNGCISSPTGVTIVQPQLLANSEFSVTQPTTCEGKGSIKINSANAAEYSFDDGVTWTKNSTANDLEPGNYLIKIKDDSGCQSSSQYAIINRVFLANPSINTIQPSCGKGGQITINTVSDFYSFDDGKTWTTEPIAKDLEPGTYLIKIKSNTGCESNTMYAYIEQFYLQIYPTYTTTQPICGTGGTITITSEGSEFSFDGGTTWSDNPVASDLLPGNYTIMFKNELGCISLSQYVNLNYFYLPTPAYTFTKPTCETGGSITITTTSNEYSFDNGTTWTTNPTASNLLPGTYYIMIKNEIGCTSATYQYVNLDYFFLPDPLYIAVSPSCGNIGSIEITTKADSYSFDGGYTWTTNPKQTNLSAGYYNLKIKNKFGCESGLVGVYLDPYYLSNPNFEITQPTCTKKGIITITTKADQYSFDGGYTWTTNPVFTDGEPNTYYNISIKNKSGCTSNYLYAYFNQFYLDTPTYTIEEATCAKGGSITITTVADQYSFDGGYTWTTNPVFSNITSGYYSSILIKNNLGCTSNYQYVNINPFYLDTPTYTIKDATCEKGGSITITTVADQYSFDGGTTWTTNPVAENLPSGYYYILIKSNLGCTSYNNAYVYLQPFYLDPPTFEITNASCGVGGTLTITTAADQYSFDGGNTWTTNPVASNLPEGYYYLVIKNKLGCVSNSQFVYIPTFYLENPTYELVNPSCENSGSITITTVASQYSFDGGYTWTANPVLLNLTDYYYSLKIKNAKGCESNYFTIYSQPAPYVPSKPIITSISPSSCGSKDGSITITSYGTSYSFDNGVTWATNSKSGPLEAGTYLVRVKENDWDCPSAATTVILNSKTTLTAPKFSITQPTCSVKTGKITVTTLASLYSFDNGVTWQTEKSKDNLLPGKYLIKIKNDKGCISDSATADITAFASFKIASYAAEQPLCTGELETGIKVTIETPASEYSFDNGLTWSTTATASNLKANTQYCLKIKNTQGCISEASCFTTIVQNTIPKAPKLIIKQATGCDDNAKGSITVDENKYQYSFDNGVTWTTNKTSGPLLPGSYFIRTKEVGSECISYAKEAIINNPPDAPSTPEVTVVQPTTCANPYGSITITTVASGYSFDNGISWTTNPKSVNIAVGTYYIKTKNSLGCESASVSVTINKAADSPANPTATLIQPDCNNAKGKITITSVSAENSFDNGITWTTNKTSSFLNPGDYLVKTKNSDGCISEASKVTLIPFTDFTVNPVGSNPQAFCIQQNATIEDLIITGQNIKWYDALTAGNLLLNTALLEDSKTYYASQTINGCESERIAVTIKIQDTPAPTGNANQTFCSDKNPTIENITVTGQDIIWYDAVTNGNVLLSNASLQNGTTYYASQTLNSCEGERLAVTVSIQNTPGAPTGDTNLKFCKSEKATLNNINITGQNLKWYDSNTSASSLANNTLVQNNTTYYVSQTVGCESDRFEVLVNVTDTPLPAANTLKTFCVDENAAISNIVISGQNLKWYDASSAGNVLTASTALESKTYYATQTNDNCESNRLGIVIKIQETQAPIADVNQSFCIQQNAIIKTIKINGQDIKWYDADGINLTESTPLEDGITYYASQTISNCESERTPVTIQIQEATIGNCINFIDELPFPKFFTPNNDGYNDTWTIDFIYLAPNSAIRIFDRYGKLIKVLNINQVWDGIYNGYDLPSSDYWFTVTRLNGAEFKSHFSLKR